jgi:hypothetical protein
MTISLTFLETHASNLSHYISCKLSHLATQGRHVNLHKKLQHSDQGKTSNLNCAQWIKDTQLVFLPFLYYEQVTDPKTLKTRRKALSKSHILEGPHSHPCLLHSIPSYMVVFPEKKLPKSHILEGSTFTSMSAPSSSLYSFLHGDVS